MDRNTQNMVIHRKVTRRHFLQGKITKQNDFEIKFKDQSPKIVNENL